MESSEIGDERYREIVNYALREPSVQRSLEYMEPKDWKDLQEKVAQIYRDLGCKADVDTFVKGAGTKHKVDVWIIFEFGGLPVSGS